MLVILYRSDEAGKLWYYTLDDRQGQLFDRYSLTVRWGRSPESGRQKNYVFATVAEKNAMIRRLMDKKLKTHKVLYSWFKEQQEEQSFNALAAERSAKAKSNITSIQHRRRQA